MAGWRVVAIVAEGESVEIGGLNVWDHTWRKAALFPVKLPHPQYPTQYDLFDVFTIGPRGARVRFAATEVSAGAWAFYAPI